MIVLKEAVAIYGDKNKVLNPKLWTPDGELKEKVDIGLKKVRDKFVEELREWDIPIKVLDTHIVGSNASFNYTEHSDIDLHIITNIDQLSDDPAMLQMVYNLYRSNFNSKYDINVSGIPVELYVEDVKASTITNGIYSLDNGEWIKVPVIREVVEIDIEDDLNAWVSKYNEVLVGNSDLSAEDLIDALYLMRKNALSVGSEISNGNLVFKEFRDRGYLEKLKMLAVDELSKKLSVESLKRLGSLLTR